MQTINRRASLPVRLKSMVGQYKIREILSTNPKTEKSEVQTYILHLSPADTSGVNVCRGAGNCRKICLHFAGNPVYMNNKQAARIRRTLAFAADNQTFALLVVCAILDKINKNAGEPIAIRLNGTSDIAWENVDFMVDAEFATFCRRKFGHELPIGKRNIFEVFNFIAANDPSASVTFYDYTKIKRNWAECRRLGYHLTVSYDGANNIANHKIVASALAAGVNVAAAFAIKKGQPLPPVAYIANRSFKVVDGDLSDYRPADPDGYHIVGLRFKLPHGVPYSTEERDAFCLDGHGLSAALKPV